jgi:hypothetical protein
MYNYEVHFTQNGPPSHFALPVRAWLDNRFTCRWMYMLTNLCVLASAKRVQEKDKSSDTGSKIKDLTNHNRT